MLLELHTWDCSGIVKDIVVLCKAQAWKKRATILDVVEGGLAYRNESVYLPICLTFFSKVFAKLVVRGLL